MASVQCTFGPAWLSGKGDSFQASRLQQQHDGVATWFPCMLLMQSLARMSSQWHELFCTAAELRAITPCRNSPASMDWSSGGHT